MNKLLLFFTAALTLAACSGGNGKQSSADSDSAAKQTSQNSPTGQPAKTQHDSVAINAAASKLAFTRNKSSKNVNKNMRIFGANVNLKMDQVSFAVTGDITVKNGVWYHTGDKFDGGVIRLDMTSIKGLQVSADQQIELKSPSFLDTEHYPTAELRISAIDTVGGNATVTGNFALRDTVIAVSFPATVKLVKGIPQEFDATLRVDALTTGINPNTDKRTVADVLDLHWMIKK